MAYTFMVIHHPKPEHYEDLLRGMTEMASSLAGKPGFIDAGPWPEVDGDRIVGISRWASKQDFFAARPPGMAAPAATVHEWETRPREVFHLHRD